MRPPHVQSVCTRSSLKSNSSYVMTLKRCGRPPSYRQNHTGPSNTLWVFTPRVEGPHAHSQTHAACSRIHSGRRRKPPQCPLGRTGSIILPKTQGHSNAPTWTDLRPSHSVTKGQRPHNSTSVRPLEQSHSGGQRRGARPGWGERRPLFSGNKCQSAITKKL